MGGTRQLDSEVDDCTPGISGAILGTHHIGTVLDKASGMRWRQVVLSLAYLASAGRVDQNDPARQDGCCIDSPSSFLDILGKRQIRPSQVELPVLTISRLLENILALV